MRSYSFDEIRAMLLPFDPNEGCSRCSYTGTKVAYEKDTSHYNCPLGKSLETSWGPEHLTIRCHRCGYEWERRCVNVEDQPDNAQADPDSDRGDTDS